MFSIGQNLDRKALSPSSLIINQDKRYVDLESNQNPLLEGNSSKSWRGGGPPGVDLLGPTAQELCLVEPHHDPDHDEHENSVKDHEKFSPSLPSRVDPSDFSTPDCHNCYCKSSSKKNCWRQLQSHCSNPSEILSKYQCQNHRKISILEEVLSWRRTPCDFARTLQTQVLHPYKQRPRKNTTLLQSIAPYCLSFKYILFILSLGMNLFYLLQHFYFANLATNLDMINCFEIQEF